MKKLLALLLALVMLFACACDGGKNGSKDDRYDAIKPGGEEAVTLLPIAQKGGLLWTSKRFSRQ